MRFSGCFDHILCGFIRPKAGGADGGYGGLWGEAVAL